MMASAMFLMAACKEDRVTGVSIEPREVVLSLGESMVLTATVTPDNAKEQTVYWFTSSPDFVTVDDNGRITCIRDWEYIRYSDYYDNYYDYVSIYAMTKESQFEDECRVWFVSDKNLKLSKSILSMSVGGKQTLTATLFDRIPSNQTVTWSSNTPQTATVNAATGEVTAVARGIAIITAATQDGGRTASCTVLVDTDILLSEDFETGYGTMLTRWTFDNGSYTNRWHVGTATENGGNQSCYISNNNSNNRYSGNSECNVRFFRELNIVSTAENPVIISFDWKVQLIEQLFDNSSRSNDRLTFFIEDDNGMNETAILTNSYAWQRSEITLPSMSGTIRVGFRWYNAPRNNSSLTAPGAAIDNILIYRR